MQTAKANPICRNGLAVHDSISFYSPSTRVICQHRGDKWGPCLLSGLEFEPVWLGLSSPTPDSRRGPDSRDPFSVDSGGNSTGVDELEDLVVAKLVCNMHGKHFASRC